MVLGAGTDVDLRGNREVRIGDFTFRRSDFSFAMETRIDLERVATAPPALWAVTELMAAPDDVLRRDRAVAAMLAAGEPRPHESVFELSSVRIESAAMPGLTLLFGPGAPAAYLLTHDVELADRLAARAGRLARALAEVLCPQPDGGRADVDLARRARQAVERFGPELVHPGLSYRADHEGGGYAIVRADRSPGLPVTEMYRKLSAWVRRPESRRLMPEPGSVG
ncbi:hypothetical protein KIH74_08645 [Kineosporia sp. J2-2]|uniref:Uncharacterized protein n=1 Tax=Kineosporia corallincola TaxID=2835133 RepID=A0ABS5TD36_9ACTN|nr:hypothetical protein [Kineosporia corallincola]MBT0768992.1 hypothetical protein [Kineosporia corallincola]